MNAASYSYIIISVAIKQQMEKAPPRDSIFLRIFGVIKFREKKYV